MKRLLNVFGNVLLTLLVMLLIAYGFAFFQLKIMMKSNLELFGYIFYLEDDNDMATDFVEGDIIIIKKDATYTVGDRILYVNKDSKFNVHTVTAVDNLSTTTKCNTCIEDNEPVDNTSVLGRVVGKLEVLGLFINFFKTKSVLIGLAVIGFACVIISQSIQGTTAKKVATEE